MGRPFLVVARPVLGLALVLALVGVLGVLDRFDLGPNAPPPRSFASAPLDTLRGLLSPKATATPTDQHFVFELTLTYPTGGLANPWEDAKARATFTSPAGKTTTVQGFYFDRDTYKVRFAPVEPGTYDYVATVTGPTGTTARSGSFEAPAGVQKGFVQVASNNPYRLVFADGSFFNLLGLDDCWYPDPNQPDHLSARNFVAAGDAVDLNTYFTTYASAGFNLLRLDLGNCGFSVATSLSPSGNTYDFNGGKLGDQLLQTATRDGFRIMLGAHLKPNDLNAATNPDQQKAIERYLDYLIARYGAYVDVWELTNESDPTNVPDTRLRFAADYLRGHDPYHHLITNSFPRDGDWSYLDVRSPHAYPGTTPSDADAQMTDLATEAKVGGRPVIFGEFGNRGCNWDSTSALRARLQIWSAFFDEVSIVFWNTSLKKDYCPQGPGNEYLGPEERGFTRVLQDFTRGADPRARIVAIAPTNEGVRGYGLRSPTTFLAYFHHFADHTQAVTTRFTLDVPISGTATWIDPASGDVVKRERVGAGQRTLTTPAFTVDLALRIGISD